MSSGEVYLSKNKLDIFQFRRRIPEELWPYVKKRELYRSLKTRNYRDALLLCRVYADECERLFQKLRKRYGVAKKDEFADLMKMASQILRQEIKVDSIRATASGILEIRGLEVDSGKVEDEMRAYNEILSMTVKHASSIPTTAVPPTEVTTIPAANMPVVKRTKVCSFAKICELYIRDRKESNLWRKASSASQMTVTETMNRGTFKLFEEFFGDRQVHLYTTEDAADFRSKLQQIPSAWKRQQRTRDLTFDQVIKLDLPKLEPGTVHDGLVRMKSLFNFAVNREFTDRNIFNSITLVKPPRKKRKPFTTEELHILFEQSNFERLQKEGYPSHYFAPLLTAYGGMRRGEVFFLTANDVYNYHDICWVFDINEEIGKDADDDDNDIDDRLFIKKVKNNVSIRMVPVHDDLIKYGFLEFVAERSKDRNDPRLFKEYPIRKGQAGHKFTEVFGSWIRESAERLGTEKRGDMFPKFRGIHAFRHLFIRESRERRVDENASRRLAGHSIRTDIHDGYGGDISEELERELMAELNAELQKLQIAKYFPKMPAYDETLQWVKKL